jgi:hypothetical protein
MECEPMIENVTAWMKIALWPQRRGSLSGDLLALEGSINYQRQGRIWRIWQAACLCYTRKQRNHRTYGCCSRNTHHHILFCCLHVTQSFSCDCTQYTNASCLSDWARISVERWIKVYMEESTSFYRTWCRCNSGGTDGGARRCNWDDACLMVVCMEMGEKEKEIGSGWLISLDYRRQTRGEMENQLTSKLFGVAKRVGRCLQLCNIGHQMWKLQSWIGSGLLDE